MDDPKPPSFDVGCDECGTTVQPVRSLGIRGEWDTTYRIDLECPACETPLGTLPNPTHPEQDITWDDIRDAPHEHHQP